MNTGDSIKAGLGQWSFSNGVDEKFDEHVRKSVPGYDLFHEISVLLSDPFVLKNSTVLDIGSSTGTFTRLLYERHKSKNPKIIGCDIEPSMVSHAQRMNEDIDYRLIDVIKDDLPEDLNLITSFFTIQFIPTAFRQQLIQKIYNSLSWGGAFLLFEKVRAPDARFQDYINHAFTNYKLNNFKAEEVIGKSNSLIGIMEPFSTQGNIDMLKRAGFVDICSVCKLLCFEGFLAIK